MQLFSPRPKQRADHFVVCPRAGLGNRMRVMVSAIHFADERQLRLAHLWCKNAPARSVYLFKDEELGANACDFETLFEPIPFFLPFFNQGQRLRLLSEHADLCQEEGLNIVDEKHHSKPPLEEHWLGVDAVMMLTALSLPISGKKKIDLYQRYFKPRQRFLDRIAARPEISEGRWLCVHLREDIRQASGLEPWRPEEVVWTTENALAEQDFDRIVVFSDNTEAKAAFLKYRFGDTPVRSVGWDTQDYVENMFLDFLAISKASLIVNSGLSSFPYEASLFGGGVRHRDVFHEAQTNAT